MGALTLEVRPDGLGVITVDVAGESQNTLREEFNEEFAAILDQLEQSDNLRGAIVRSGKSDSFIAGADIRMLESVRTAEEAADISRRAHAAFARLEGSPIPVVAAIHGACLGGGLELALACHGRVASTAASTQLGLPECQLGLIPGAGGTQRLPRRVGIAVALDLMLTGKKLDGKRALSAGLVDEVVPEGVLLDAAIRRVFRLAEAAKRPKRGRGVGLAGFELRSADGLQRLLLETNPIGRQVLFAQARKNLAKTTRGNYPAHERIIDVVEVGYARGIYHGLAAEAEAFGRAVVSDEAEALIGMFHGVTALKRETGLSDAAVAASPIHHVGVLGAGLMGAGIAYVTVEKADIDVRMKDADAAGVSRGLATLDALWSKAVSKRRVIAPVAARQLRRVSTTTGYDGFSRSDVVIEAVPEVLELKHIVMREIEAVTGLNTVFATNTSSIPIAQIASASARPQNVIGMHYFSPVEKMPLLEVIVTPLTSAHATATAVALGKAQGKTVIVVNDGPGFYTSRILAPYMNEAAHLLAEGVAIDTIDDALTAWGFPIGPMMLLDEVGIDVAAKVGPILIDAFGARMEQPGATELLIRDGRLGKKAKRGLYDYRSPRRGGKRPVDASVYALLGVSPSSRLDANTIAERCALQMVNEAVLCLEEGVLRSPRDGDIGAIFGLGFPPFRGGPFRFVDQVGASRVVERLREFESEHGLRFKPARRLVEMAEKSQTFH